MTIAELFVKLGITGSNEAKKELGSVKDKLGDISAGALAMKAGILGAMYGFHQFSSAAAKSGTDLIQFSNLTGMNIEKLQRYEYAMMQGGGSAEEFRQSISTLQDQMTAMVNLGEAAPKGFVHFMSSMRIDPNMLKDNFYLIDKLQDYAKNMKLQGNPETAKLLMKTMGMTDGVVSSMMDGVFNAKNFKAAPVMSESMARAQKGVDIGWKNYMKSVETGVGRLSIKFSPQLLKDLNKLTPQVFKLAEAFAELAKKTEFMAGLGIATNALTTGLKDLTELVTAIKDMDFGKMWGAAKKLKTPQQMMQEYGEEKLSQGAGKLKDKLFPTPNYFPASPLKGGVKPGSSNITNNINQTLNFQHSGKDAQKTSSDVGKAAKKAVSQMKTKAQVN